MPTDLAFSVKNGEGAWDEETTIHHFDRPPASFIWL